MNTTEKTKPTLVILAAGLGSRYGGMKQLEAVGPDGSSIMDYSVYDAARAGFGKVVLIIRPDMEKDVREKLLPRFSEMIESDCALQRKDDLPAGFTPPAERQKPWGTGHAVLAARNIVNEPFSVINADDFYGNSSFQIIADFLNTEVSPELYAMVGFHLRDTLTDAGSVSRGVCHADDSGMLTSITEITNIEKKGNDGRYIDENGREHLLPGSTLVSMNLWGFHQDFFNELNSGFRNFLDKSGNEPRAEYYIVDPVQKAISENRVHVRVLPTGDSWAGITHPRDLKAVQNRVLDLVKQGVYPEKLWK